MKLYKIFICSFIFSLLFSISVSAASYSGGSVSSSDADYQAYYTSSSGVSLYFCLSLDSSDDSTTYGFFVGSNDSESCAVPYFWLASSASYSYTYTVYYVSSGVVYKNGSGSSPSSVTMSGSWAGFYTSNFYLWNQASYFTSATAPVFADYSSAADFFFNGGTDLDGNTYSDYYSDDLSAGDDSSGILSWLGDLFSSLSAWFSSLIDAITQGFSSLLDGICDFFVSLFIPEDGYIDDCCAQISDMFTVTFGVSGFDLQDVVADEKPLQDIDSAYTIFGIQFSETFINFDFVIDALATFRPYIRGFIVLMLVFFSINQILLLIGQAPLSIQGIVEINEAASRSEREPIGFKGPNS